MFPKKYKASEIEVKKQQEWLEEATYKWDKEQTRKNNFVIDTPPPTVSGELHMGHIFSYCQADFVARYQRMKGKNVYYPIGFDDNGLPTERLVEKIKKIKGSQMPREEFVKICKAVSFDAEESYRELFKSIAISCDWDEEYQTNSDKVRTISQMSFLNLHQKGFLERKFEPCYWCTTDQTALAAADIEDKELPSKMVDIPFALQDGKTITIATTRPEMLAACVAIFVHPDDEKYKHIVGQKAKVALYGFEVEVKTDELVDREKGTGAVMCCSFGDMTDVIWWKKHKLDSKIIVEKYGKIKKDIEFIGGLKVKKAREEILNKLKEENLILAEKDISHPVKCAERSGDPIEIMLTNQWFVKILDKKQELLEKIEDLNWHPKHMQIRLKQWIEGLAYDWCISRQRFFGVPIPVWYVVENSSIGHTDDMLRGTDMDTLAGMTQNKSGKKIIAKQKNLPVDPMSSAPEGYSVKRTIKEGVFITEKDNIEYLIVAEKDILDTWATSSLTPQIAAEAINDEFSLDVEKHKKIFPADLRPQAHEIIRSWAFYTIVKSYLHTGELPWKDLMISGWCLAKDKTKMSKSKGNVVTPVALIQEKGADIVRYWAATSHLGTDTAYSETVLAIGKKLTNKLFNASKFASQFLGEISKADISKITFASDKWILANLQEVIKKAEEEFEKYEYAKALAHIDNFFWKDFCDYYLEITKTRSYGDQERISEFATISDEKIKEGKESSCNTIYLILDNILRLYAPFIPHITDELHSIIFSSRTENIHIRGSWAKLEGNFAAEENYAEILEIIDFIRKHKSDNEISLSSTIEKITLEGDWNKEYIEKITDLIFVCSIKEIEFRNAEIRKITIS